MAASSSVCVTGSGSSTSYSSCHPSKLVTSEFLSNGVSFGLSPSSINNKKKSCSVPITITITCRFTRPHPTTSTYRSSKRGGMASSLEATAADMTAAPTSVPVRVAHELLLAGHRYLDVRTPEEFSAGHVPGAVNIPYMLRVGSGMAKNTNFLDQVSSQFGKDDEILIGCQSGKRSVMAANDLVSAGHSGILDVAGGYAAWNQSELPAQVC